MATTWTVPATVIRIVDGDTVKLDLDLGWRIHLTANARLLDHSAPEMDTDAGRTARDALAAIVPAGTACTFTSHGLDKYGRPLGVLMRQGVSVADLLLRQEPT